MQFKYLIVILSLTNNHYVYPTKPETFSATLEYSDEVESMSLVGFRKDGQSEFTTQKEAFEVALYQVKDIIFTRGGDYFLPIHLPENALILFDTEKAKERFARSYPDKQ